VGHKPPHHVDPFSHFLTYERSLWLVAMLLAIELRRKSGATGTQAGPDSPARIDREKNKLHKHMTLENPKVITQIKQRRKNRWQILQSTQSSLAYYCNHSMQWSIRGERETMRGAWDFNEGTPPCTQPECCSTTVSAGNNSIHVASYNSISFHKISASPCSHLVL
jgi:hypothetical protein